MPRKLACLLLTLAVCQSTPVDAEPSAADTLLAHGVQEIVFAERSFGPDGQPKDEVYHNGTPSNHPRATNPRTLP